MHWAGNLAIIFKSFLRYIFRIVGDGLLSSRPLRQFTFAEQCYRLGMAAESSQWITFDGMDIQVFSSWIFTEINELNAHRGTFAWSTVLKQFQVAQQHFSRKILTFHGILEWNRWMIAGNYGPMVESRRKWPEFFFSRKIEFSRVFSTKSNDSWFEVRFVIVETVVGRG